VPGSDWTVGEVGAHVVTVAQRLVRMLEGEPAELTVGTAMAERNAAEIAALPPLSLTETADELEAAHEKLRLALGGDGARRVLWFQVDVAVMEGAAIYLGELLVHGLDLASALGAPWKIRRDQALVVVDGVFAVVENFVKPDVAATLDATFHVSLRGGGDYTVTVGGGTAHVAPGKPERADLHVSADPVAYLLVGYGRRSQWPAILTGRIAAWGRKPMLALEFGKLFEQP
jgi:uncharacterized protein (TIGR03083 family)